MIRNRLHMTKLHAVLGILGLCLWPGILPGLVVSAVRAEGGDFSAQSAPGSPAWLRDGVICEIFPRDFSPAGDLNGVTAKLDQLHNLGITILWIMPIHPIGEK